MGTRFAGIPVLSTVFFLCSLYCAIPVFRVPWLRLLQAKGNIFPLLPSLKMEKCRLKVKQWNSCFGTICGTGCWELSVELAVGDYLWNWLLGTICGAGCWEPSVELAVGSRLWNWLLGTVFGTGCWELSPIQQISTHSAGIVSFSVIRGSFELSRYCCLYMHVVSWHCRVTSNMTAVCGCDGLLLWRPVGKNVSCICPPPAPSRNSDARKNAQTRSVDFKIPKKNFADTICSSQPLPLVDTYVTCISW